jgi:hypothetical protein
MVASVASTPNGVAPGASIGSYRVFGCSGYATDDILIEAIDRAVRDGCDIINLSLATGSGYADWVSALLGLFSCQDLDSGCCQGLSQFPNTLCTSHQVCSVQQLVLHLYEATVRNAGR